MGMIGVGDTGTVWMVRREVKLHSNATKPTYLAFVLPREVNTSSPRESLAAHGSVGQPAT